MRGIHAGRNIGGILALGTGCRAWCVHRSCEGYMQAEISDMFVLGMLWKFLESVRDDLSLGILDAREISLL